MPPKNMSKNIRLMDLCLAALEKQITDEVDARQMLAFLRDKGSQCLFDYNDLEWKCLQVAYKSDADLIESPEFLCIRHELLARFLRLEQIGYPEIALYRKVNEWAMKRVEALGGDPNALDQKRSVLGNVPDLLKIELISAKQFVEEIVPMGIYGDDKVQQIRQHFADKWRKMVAYARKYAHKYTSIDHGGAWCERLQHEYECGHSALQTARNMNRGNACPYNAYSLNGSPHALHGCARCLSAWDVQAFFDTLAQRTRRMPRRCKHGEADFKKCQRCW